MCPGWCQVGAIKSPVTGREKKISIFQDSQRKHLMCDNIRCHIRISPGSDQFCRHVTSLMFTSLPPGRWILRDGNETPTHHCIQSSPQSSHLNYDLLTYLASVCSISGSVGWSICLRCWFLSEMLWIGAELEGEGGLTPSRYTMAGSPLQDRRWSTLLYSHKSGRWLEWDWGQS